MQPLSYRKIRILLFCFFGFCLLLIGIYIYNINHNPYGDQLEINNLNSYTSGKPSDVNTLKYIQSHLYRIVNQNNHPPVKNNSVKDILIRRNSYSQTYSETGRVYTVHFIVDIKSLKQSYGVDYQWINDNKYGPNKDEYGTQVSCLALDKLIYGDFNCVDDRILEKGRQYYNPIEKVLPHTVKYKYTIKKYSAIVETKKARLDVEAFVPSWADKDVVLGGYTTEIKDWIKSKKLNPDDYYFDYTY